MPEAQNRWKPGITWALIFMLLIATPALAGVGKGGRAKVVKDTAANCNKTKTCVPPPADTTPPKETIDRPSDNAKVSGIINVTGTATDDVRVASVAVAIDAGSFAPATGTTSWALAIDTTTLSNAAHTITARATDAAGNRSTAQISVDVANVDTTSTGTGTGTGSTSGSGSASGSGSTTGTQAGCDKMLDGPGNIQTALNALAAGQTLCLSGTFTVTAPLRPKTGQTVSGPATVVGQGLTDNQDVFSIKPVAGVTLVDLDISGAGRHGVGCWIGTTVTGGRLHDNGKDGMGCDLEGYPSAVLVTGVEIDHNGTNPYWFDDAAGIKWFHANGVTVRDSTIHDNTGSGVWCDTHCGDFTVKNDTIVRNTRKGVFYEKSGESDGSFLGRTWAIYVGTATIVNNVIRDNDLVNVPQAHAGVSIYSSKNAYIAGNVFGGNGRAVIAREDTARLTDDQHGWHLSNVVIENNTLNGDELVGCTSDGVRCTANG